MAGLSQKDTKTLLDSLEQQGAVIIPRKNGWTVRFINGDTLGVHKTASDTKSFDAMRAVVKRAGLNWPFDGKDKKAMNAQTRRLGQENRELVRMFLEENHAETVNPATIVKELGLHMSVVYRALHALGWTKLKYGEWGPVAEPVEKPPHLLEGEVEIVRDMLSHSPGAKGYELPHLSEEPEPGPEPEWTTVRLTKGIADITINELLNTYRAGGFQLEIRIRKEVVK